MGHIASFSYLKINSEILMLECAHMAKNEDK